VYINTVRFIILSINYEKDIFRYIFSVCFNFMNKRC